MIPMKDQRTRKAPDSWSVEQDSGGGGGGGGGQAGTLGGQGPEVQYSEVTTRDQHRAVCPQCLTSVSLFKSSVACLSEGIISSLRSFHPLLPLRRTRQPPARQNLTSLLTLGNPVWLSSL